MPIPESLIADLTAVATTCTLTPTGIGNEEYAANGGVAIGGSEICSFTRSGDVLTLGRGYNGVATTHNAGDRVQTVLFYTATDPANIIYDLLVNYTSINAGDIDLTAWQAETTSYLNRLYTARIAQPTSVNTLVSEIIEQAGLSMWWDDRNQTVGLLVLHGLVNDALFSDDNMLANSFEVTEQFDKRLTQVHVYFGQINWLTSLSDKANYRSVSKSIDTQAESDYGSPIIKEIFSRWIPALGDSTADRVGSILLSRFRDPPRHIKTSFIRDSVDEIALARGYQIQSWPMQDETGAAETVNVQVTRLRPMADVIEVEADEVLFTAAAEDLTVRQIVVSSDARNINLRTSHDLLFPAPAAGITVVCTVNSGIRIGSTISSAIALDIGTWPAGVTIVVFISGGIRGAGGKGGDWGAQPGTAGGTALYTRYAINLALDGTLWGGGGGGGASLYSPVAGFGGAGGGGAGFDPGLGGQGNGGTGATGTETAGGAAFTFGGPGGGAGLVGVAGSTIIEGGFTYPGQAGGAAGRAIDGVSFVTTGSWDGTTFTPGALGGDLRGSQVN